MRFVIRVVATVVVLIAMAVQAGDSRAAINVFGDSLSDTGNLFTSLPFVFDPTSPFSRFPTPPFVDGQASNGPVWVQQLASRLGMAPVAPSLAGGTNYAFIAALTRDFPAQGIVSPFGAPSLDDQVATYLASNTPDSTDLFALWGGANDFFFGQTDPIAPVQALSDQITSLASAGATEFIVPNLPLLGMTPSGAASGDADALNFLSMIFNDSLDATLDSLRSGLGVTIHEIDIEQLFFEILADPSAFGITTVDAPAVTTILDPTHPLFGFPTFPAEVAPNPDEYLFWDGVHPSRVTHQFIGDLAANSVIPEPSTLAIWSLFVLLGFGYTWRRRG